MKGYDCSGFVQELLWSVGMLDHRKDLTAQLLHDTFKTELTTPKFGALAFYGKSKSQISHVAFALNETLMLEAGGGGSATTSLEAAAKQNAFIRMRPIKGRSDLVALKLPYYPWEKI